MKKHFLFLPFLALLATSCASYANTTTPVVKNAPSGFLSHTRKNAYITPANNEFDFNISITIPDKGTSYFNLKDGLEYSFSQITKPSIFLYITRISTGLHNIEFYLSTETNYLTFSRISDPTQTLNQNFYGHISNFSSQGLEPYSSTAFRNTQSIITLAGHAIISKDFNDGYNYGYSEGYDEGYNDGYYQGEASGYDEGYSEGLEDGQEEGFELALAQSQFSSPSAKYDGFIFLPSHELLRQYCVDLWAGTKTFQPFVVNFLSDDFSTNPNSEHNKEETPLVFKYVEEQATDTHLIYIYWGDPNWYRTTNQLGDPTDNADFELKQVAIINVKDIANNVWASTRIAQWNSTNWEWEVPLTPSTPYFGKPLTIPMAKKIHRGNFFLGNTAIWSPSEIINLDSFYIGTPTSAQNATIQEELNILLVGSGSLYAQGYEDGQQEAIETSEAYNNVFLIFLPAFSAVASFFNMSVGPFKLYYFFVIPLIVAILVLVIKLVKH